MHPRLRSIPSRVVPALLALLVTIGAACTDTGIVLGPGGPTGYRAHPGFDTSIYPGDATLADWRAPASPYEWVGYYLPAPCHRDTSWVGRRATLSALGWGTAVLYVGQQTWDWLNADVAPLARRSAEAKVTSGPTCSRSLLTPAQGTIDAMNAAARAASEGFPRGTVVFLDLEYMATVTDSMRLYYRSWVSQMLADGRYEPGVYLHKANAPIIHDDVVAEYAAAGRSEPSSFWITGSAGFTLDRVPTDVGLPYAAVWQGQLDVTETLNGHSVNLDRNVAARRSPSDPTAY